MIDNEKNNINEEGNSEESTQAFEWGWHADERPAEDKPQETPAEETVDNPQEEPVAENADEQEPTDVPENEETADESEVKSEPECECKNERENKTAAEPPKKEKKNYALVLAGIISATSIVLLVAFAISVMLGVFPTVNVGGNINVSGLGQTQPDTEATPELLEEFLNSVVLIRARNETTISTGSGVIISEDGYIVTNYHVVEDTDIITVQLYGDDVAMEAKLVGYRAEDDVAVLKINKTGLRAATFAKSDDVRYGEKVYAIGNPEGADFSWSITQGIVSCPKRQLMFYDEEGILEKKMNVVQTDAPVNHGNSGGPIINVRGEIVGIVTFKRTDSAGMGFAIPADGVLIDVTAIIKTGSADGVNSGIAMPRPLLGITGVGVKGETYYKNVINNGQSAIEEVDEAYAKAHPSTTFYAAITGVHVSAVSAGSDASRYLKVNDIITEVNGKPVTSIYDIMGVVNMFNGGDTVTITYYRNGSYKTVEVMLKTAQELN